VALASPAMRRCANELSLVSCCAAVSPRAVSGYTSSRDLCPELESGLSSLLWMHCRLSGLLFVRISARKAFQRNSLKTARRLRLWLTQNGTYRFGRRKEGLNYILGNYSKKPQLA
jgi:hypothetical protein